MSEMSMETLLSNICGRLAGEWFGIAANEYEKSFLNTFLPNEAATTVTPTLNGFPGPKYNCSKGENSSAPTDVRFQGASSYLGI